MAKEIRNVLVISIILVMSSSIALEISVTEMGDFPARAHGAIGRAIATYAAVTWPGGDTPVSFGIRFEELPGSTQGLAQPWCIAVPNTRDTPRYIWERVTYAMWSQMTRNPTPPEYTYADPRDKGQGFHGVLTFQSVFHAAAGNVPYAWRFDDTPPKFRVSEVNGVTVMQQEQDFESVVIHELGHALGFVGAMGFNAKGFDFDFPSPFEYCVGYEVANVIEPWMKPHPLAGRSTWANLLRGPLAKVVWNGYYDPSEGRVDESRSTVRSFMSKHVHPPEVLDGGCVLMYTPEVWDNQDSYSHWTNRLAPDLSMASGAGYGGLDSFRDSDITPLALKDMGWELPPNHADSIKHRFRWENSGKKADDYPEQTLKLWVYSGNLAVHSARIIGTDSDQFQIVRLSATVPANLVAVDCFEVKVEFRPTSLGIKTACLQVQYADTSEKLAWVPLEGYSTGVDSDFDGISGADETRDLDTSTPQVDNPFNPNLSDSTGDNGQIGPDGIPDGENDWDGDGYSNADELLLGSNPLSPASIPAPIDDGISRTSVIANNATWDMHITGIAIQNDPSHEFFITRGGEPGVLRAHCTRSIGVAFSPLSAGRRNAQIRVQYTTWCGQEETVISLAGGQ